ncbi:MAG: TetR/AcrR family transcriptional regulator, partial [Shinella sp.]
MAGRPRSIDRDKVLDAAESIVVESGAAGLSFEAVARAAGITKGGVQYCFGTKENLIRAMIER